MVITVAAVQSSQTSAEKQASQSGYQRTLATAQQVALRNIERGQACQTTIVPEQLLAGRPRKGLARTEEPVRLL